MKLHLKIAILLIFNALFYSITQAQNANLKLHYNFSQKANSDSIIDEISSNNNAKLNGSAKIKQLGDFGILEIGKSTGYVEMGKKTGDIVSTLNDFCISTYLYIDPSLVLSNNGNFVWTFSNAENILSNANGCMFYSAKNSRYAISTTNYSNEKQVNINTAATKASWQHILYRQTVNTGEIYINGILVKSATINIKPADLGNTSFNYLAKSCYNGDQYLLNSKFCDFRIYDKALTASQIVDLAKNTAKLDTLIFKDIVDSVKFKLNLGDLSKITSNINLPTSDIGDVSISWSSSNANIISSTGTVNRPIAGTSNVNIILTATITKNFISSTKTFNATVVAQYSNLQSVTADVDSLNIKGNINNLRSNLALPTIGYQSSTISWTSSAPSILNANGQIINRPTHGSGSYKVTLTAIVSKGNSSANKSFDIYVAEDEGFAAYLFTYFTGNNINQEAIRFAISDNGLNYMALNEDQAIIASSSISQTGGVRDPHILRTETGSYYMVVTDMVSANGWNSNRGLVLLKSSNLTDWTSTAINIPTTYPSEFAGVDRVWAPQTIYDPEVGKYMVYFSMRKGATDFDKIYYAYANANFTAFETAPKLLFQNPQGTATIDGDIIEKDGIFHMFFKTEGSGNGIKKAIASSLTSNWTLIDKYLDQSSNAVEGGCVFRLYNTDDYILMYDVYSSGYYEFTKSTDLENFSVLSGNSFDFTPRHGTIIPITDIEKNALNNKWGNSTKVNSTQSSIFNIKFSASNSNAIVEGIEAPFQMNIFDLQGRKIFSQNCIENATQLPKFSKGIYIVLISKDKLNIVKQKLLIN